MQNRNILMVDNDPAVLQAQGDLLECVGHCVIRMQSSSEALEHIQQHGGSVDLLVTDFDMHGMDGLDLVWQVRGLGFAKPILVITGGGDEKRLQKIEQWGAEVMMKPVHFERLDEYTRRLWERCQENQSGMTSFSTGAIGLY